MDWKSSTITPIFKKGSKHSLANYQSISQTSIIVKVLIHERITEFLVITKTFLYISQHSSDTIIHAKTSSMNWSISGVRFSTGGHQHIHVCCFPGFHQSILLCTPQWLSLTKNWITWVSVVPCWSGSRQFCLVDDSMWQLKGITLLALVPSKITCATRVDPTLYVWIFINDIWYQLPNYLRMTACALYWQVN